MYKTLVERKIMNAQDAQQLVRSLIDAEFSAGFPVLRRIPSPSTWKALVYIEGLCLDERDRLFDVFAERGCAWLRTDVDMNQYVERHKELVRDPAYAAFLNGYGAASPVKYADVHFLRDWLNVYQQFAAVQPTAAEPPDFGPVPLEVVQATEPPVPAKATEIRKAVKQAFTPRFHVKPANLGSGVWNYPGDFDGRPFTLTLHWGSYMKMRYGFVPGNLAVQRPLQGINGVTWEGMLISGIGHWDFVCQHNLAASVELLGEIVEKLVSLHARYCLDNGAAPH